MRKAALLAGVICIIFLVASYTLAQGTTTTTTTTGGGRLVANKAFLLDFGSYQKLVSAQVKKNNDQVNERMKNRKTYYTGLPIEKFKMEASDWQLDKWGIELNSSASSVLNIINSYVTNVKSKFWADRHKKYYGGQKIGGYNADSSSDVLGARIHFPTLRQNCWAKIKPPFDIYAYDEQGNVANAYNGVVDNVGQIKAISVWIKGRNYQNGFAVRLKNRLGNEVEYYLGTLYFDNWRELTWLNPNYIENPKDRTLIRLPLYPRSRPFVKFSCFVVYRQMDMPGGDFVLYVRNVRLTYDKAVADDAGDDINDEKVWGILAKARQKAKVIELSKLAERKVLLQQERAKLKKTKTTQ
ncbi:MAG: hypothetical protein KAR07_12140 [Spirochaetes bacterium]|nr:hypothetical protein [Spirochaetota bacterium]